MNDGRARNIHFYRQSHVLLEAKLAKEKTEREFERDSMRERERERV